VAERGATLVIHPGALGDVLQAVPALRALRTAGSITFAGQPRFGGLLHGLGLVDAAVAFDALPLSALFTSEPLPAGLAERLASFEHVVSWFGARDATYRERLGRVTRHVVIASPVSSDASPVPVWRHLVNTLVDAIGATSSPATEPVPVPTPWRLEANRALDRLGVRPEERLLVVHPGAGAAWKCWPVDDLARAIARVRREASARIVVHQGPADRDAVTRLLHELAEPATLLIEPELTLLSAILSSAAAYLGSDSGVSHLAAAVGAPAIIRFPEATRDRWTPWASSARPLGMGAQPERPDDVARTVTAIVRASSNVRG
jgi:ADP-heptose:LPS heptosyltransferase